MKIKLSHYTALALLLVMGALAACTPSGAAPEQGQVEATQPAEGVVAVEPTLSTDEAQPEIATLYVGPELVECTGAAPQMCMQVKNAPEDEYSLFYSQIDGFTFVPGYEYELQVEISQVANPPADGSSLNYRLIEVVNQTPVDSNAMSDLEGTRWALVDYQDGTGNTVAAAPGVEAAIEFNDGSVSGTAGCNSFSGGYTVDGNTLTVGPLASTMMACMDSNVMQQESDVLANLQAAATYTIEGDVLTIANAEGETTLTFKATEPISLTATNWEATSYNNGNEAVVSLIVGTTITADFGEDGTLSGNAGCNQYTTSYTVDGDAITIEPVASTMMFCGDPEGMMDQETLYLQALPTAATYQIDGTTLTLRTAEGAMVANYTVSESMVDMQGATASPEVVALLANATYPLDYDYTTPGTVTLVDGALTLPASPDGTSSATIHVELTDHVAVGQSKDGQDMVAVVLNSNTGGSGTFYDLAVATLEDGMLGEIYTVQLGDRVGILSLAIEDGVVTVDMVEQGPQDPLCCATQHVVRTYEIVDNALVLTNSEMLGTIQN